MQFAKAKSTVLQFSVLLCVLLCVGARGQQISSPAKAKAYEQKTPEERGDVIDRVVAIVNGNLVLESDLEEEERFTKLYPYNISATGSLRDKALNRLIDRDLILQQLTGYPQAPVTDDQIEAEELDLRKDLPGCAHVDCTTDAGWIAFLKLQGFTHDELHERLRQRAQVLKFVEQRFRSGVRVSDKQVSEYYTKTMLPQYAKQNANAPPLDSIHDRIEEVLLEQQVSTLLDQWLKTLRDNGSVRLLRRGEEAP